MPNSTFANTTTEWGKLLVTIEANKAELPYQEERRAQLASIMERAQEASIRQAAFKAQFQQATRDVEKMLSEGWDVATRLRNGIRTQYGLKAEKLAEFNLQPRRKPQKSLAKRKKNAEPVVEPAMVSKTDAGTESQP
jgi:hypothetical protein